MKPHLCAAVIVWTVAVSGSSALHDAAGDQEVLARARMDADAGQRLTDGGFEGGASTPLDAWAFWEKGYETAPDGGRDGTAGIRCTCVDAREQCGGLQRVVLKQQRPRPIVATGWSRAEKVDGSPNPGYAIYLDIGYTDGTHLWGQTADFATGTHGWERRQCVVMPEKPIDWVVVYPLFRGHTGAVYFDDFTLVELDEALYLFEGVPIRRDAEEEQSAAPEKAPDSEGVLVLDSGDGLTLHLDKTTGSVQRVVLLGNDIGGDGPGIFVRDVAADSGFLAPEQWTWADTNDNLTATGDVETLGLRLSADFKARQGHIAISCRVADLRGTDRAVTLYFGLPVAPAQWIWSQDMRRDVPADAGVFLNVRHTGAGATGARSLYPLAALSGPAGGLAMAVPMDAPRHHRLGYDACRGMFYAGFDLGLSPDTAKSPGSATCRWVLYAFDPAWRFRAALARYYALFPESFVKRVPREGLWMAFTDISTVQGWEDFGFAYHEGINNVPWDEDHGILSFIYTEPMTHWLPLPEGIVRTQDGSVTYLERLLEGDDAGKRAAASATRVSAVRAPDGRYVLGVHDAPWCDGCVFALNPDPDLPATEADPVTRGLSELERIERAIAAAEASVLKKPGSGNAPNRMRGIDGTYIDSYQFWATTLNYNRAHFASAGVPPVFDAHTYRVGLLTVFSTFEFEAEVARRMHAQGRYVMANGVLWDYAFPAHYLDVLGTETNWFRDGKWAPMEDAGLCFKRAMCCQKPYCFLMNTHYADLTPALTERYMQRSLFYGMFPGFFSENAAQHCYFDTPEWYEPARALFKRYVPLVTRIAAAGWEPVTYARASDHRVYLERYGAPHRNGLFFAALNETPDAVEATIVLDLDSLGLAGKPIAVTPLLGSLEPDAANDRPRERYTIRLQPHEAHLVQVALGDV